MKYRIICIAAFDTMPPPTWLKRIRDYFLDNAVPIHPGTPSKEASVLRLEECHHDETPPGPCQIIEEHYKED